MNKYVKIVLPFLLGTAILFWIYRGFPMGSVKKTLLEDMKWEWIVASLVFGIIPQILRGLRWHQVLVPLGYAPPRRRLVEAVFLSFAASLIIPRIGEITRCGTIRSTDGVSFTKSLGTVVTERVIDCLLVVLIVGFVTFWQLPVFISFFSETGASWGYVFGRFTTTGYLVVFLCASCSVFLLTFIIRKLSLFGKIKGVFLKLMEGVYSLRAVKNKPLYALYSIMIWVCYFLHFYLAFYAFDFTSNLGIQTGLVAFCMITVAVLVPTPNGAGPWHFAVKTILVLYGVSAGDAILFALIVHSFQTILLIVLGVYAMIALPRGVVSLKNSTNNLI